MDKFLRHLVEKKFMFQKVIIISVFYNIHLYICKHIDKVLERHAQVIISGECSKDGIRGGGQRETDLPVILQCFSF